MTNETAIALPDEQAFRDGMDAITKFQAIVRTHMIPDHDFGVIPGTQKPTLLKPGAEKIAKLLGLADEYEIVDQQDDWDRPLFRYLIRCRLVSIRTGVTLSQGLGECNSMEAKYRWREAKRTCPVCSQETIIKGKSEYGGGWLCFAKLGGCGEKFPDDDDAITAQQIGKIPNDDIYSQVNTILKMAKKRALVDAALSAGRLSDLFTQDMEDIRSAPEPTPSDEMPHDDAKGTRPVTDPQIQRLWAITRDRGVDQQAVRDRIATYGAQDPRGLTMAQYDEVVAWVEEQG